MTLLTRDLILSVNDLKKERVSVPEWGGDIYISMMTGESRDAWEQSLASENGANLANIRARLIAFTAVGEDGKRLFTNEDAQLLGQKSSIALERCTKVAQKLNKLTTDDLESLSKLKNRPQRRFYFDLALKLGMPVGEMLRRMDSAEITEWLAYFRVDEVKKPKAADVLKAQFANRVKKKDK